MRSRGSARGVRFSLLATALLLLGGVLAIPSSATFSGRNGRITFVRFVDRTKSAEIFSARPNGRDVKKLTTSGRNHGSVISDWSPNGRRIAIDSDRVDIDGRKDVVQIYVIKADGSGVTQLTRGPGFHGSPGWAPSGTRLAIDADWGHPHLQGIWIIPVSDPDGVRRPEARRLTHGLGPRGYDSEPQFSPNGKTIVFSRFKDLRHSAIFRVPVTGGKPKELTPFGINASDPDWSPNGRRISFDSGDSGRRGAKGDIYVMRANGTGMERLTDNPRLPKGLPGRLAQNPVWSPSGTKIMYTQYREHGSVLKVMRRDGSGKHVVLRRSGFPNKIDWGSRP